MLTTGDTANGAESRKEFASEEKPEAKKQRLWCAEIENAATVFRDWFAQTDMITKRYRDERKDADAEKRKSRKYNALWSVVRTLQPNLFTELPPPFLQRQFNDADPVARDASMLLERTIAADIEGDALHDAVKEARDDFILGGRGTIWAKYSAVCQLRETDEKMPLSEGEKAPEDHEEKSEGGFRYYHKKVDRKVREEIDWEHVHLKSFLHGPAAKWRHVPWVARKVPMLKDELKKRFGEKLAGVIPLTLTDRPKKAEDNETQDNAGLFARAEVWEIWDRVSRKVYWLCPQYKDSLLDEKGDILGLPGFFPCPRPAFATTTNDRLDPVPDYIEWQDIAIELDDVTLRIKLLTKSMAVKGAYNAELGGTLKEIVEGNENTLVPVDNWAMFAEAGGFKGSVDWFPIEVVSATLDKLVQLRGQLVQELYEITGVGDVIRGSSDPRDTATAQQIKGQFASQRLKTQQRELARMVREAYHIMAEIIAEHYDDATIMAKSDAQQLLLKEDGTFDTERWEMAIALIRDDDMRRFRINVNNETMGGDDFQRQGQEVQSFIQNVGSLVAQALPLAQQAPAIADVCKQLILLGTRQFRPGRAIEATMERALDQLVQQAKNPPPAPEVKPTGKSPEELEIMRDQVRVHRERLGVDRQRLLHEERRDQQTLQVQREKIQADIQLKQFDAHLKVNEQQHELQMSERDAQRADQDAAHNRGLQARDQQHRERMDITGRNDEREMFVAGEASKERDRRHKSAEASEDRYFQAHERMASHEDSEGAAERAFEREQDALEAQE